MINIARKIYRTFDFALSRDAAKKSRTAKLLRKVLGYIFIPKTINVLGRNMIVHKTGHSFELAFDGIYEVLETNFIKSLDLEGGVVFDIGACIGYYTILLSDSVGDKGAVHVFEPEDENYRLLESNVQLNQLRNVTLNNVAVGDKSAQVALAKHKSPGQHAIYSDRLDERREKMMVDMVSIDDCILKNNIDFQDVKYIKIDVEGYEMRVLHGVRELVSVNNDLVIQVELAPQHFREQHSDIGELLKYISDFDLNVYYWNLRIKKLVRISNSEWLELDDTIQDFEDGMSVSRNILLTKKLLHNHIVELFGEHLHIDNDGAEIFRQAVASNAQAYGILPPRSGQFFVKFLENIDLLGKKVLDLGTGHFGYIVRHAKIFGASDRVVAIDVNARAIEHARKYFGSGGVEYRVGDVYAALDKEEKFDVICSNPPQLPSDGSWDVHDVSGERGLDVIGEMLKGLPERLNVGGALCLLIFDFLFDDVKLICDRNNLAVDIVAFYRKHIRKGGETEKRIESIAKIFPRYSFGTCKNGYWHNILIVKIVRNENHSKGGSDCHE